MAFFGSLFTKNQEKRSIQDAISAFLSGDDYEQANTSSGVSVNEDTALTLTAVYSAVNIISNIIAMLPIHVYKRLAKGKERAQDSPLYKLLHDEPNSEQTAFRWKKLTVVHQLLWGAGISEIEFDRSGQPIALWPLPPWYVKPYRNKSGNLLYKVQIPNEKEYVLNPYQVFCVQTLNTSDTEFLSPIGVHRESIGSAIAVKKYGAKVFGQGTNPSGVITHPASINESGKKTLREAMDAYAGLSNSHRLMLLDQGMKFERIGLPPQDSQYLESRKFDTSEVGRMYNIPLHLLQDHEKSTSWGSGIEEMNQGLITFTLQPEFVQWEQELQKKVIKDDQYFCEFLAAGLLRGKLLERYQAYQIAHGIGMLNPNEMREIENMNPIEEESGNMYMVPLNFVNADKAYKGVQEQNKQVDTSKGDEEDDNRK